MEKVKKISLLVILWASFLMIVQEANATSFITKNNYVTMDVDSGLGWASGTYVCKDAVTCYELVRRAEARGAHQYCNSVVMKRDGRVIWFKNYLPK